MIDAPPQRINCRTCRHHHVEEHIAPAVVTCKLLTGQLGCSNCKGFANTDEWKWVGGGTSQIRCPACASQMRIPQAHDWQMGCCGLNSQTVIVPLKGVTHGLCDDFEPIEQAGQESPE